MRSLTLVITFLALFAGAPVFAVANDKEAIQKIEKDWANAMVDGDGAWFNKNLTDDFKIVFPEGAVWDRDKFADAWTAGTIDMAKCDNLHLDIRIIGDVAIVIGQGDVAGKFNGEAFAHTEKWTDVYIKKGDTWKCVSCHVCKVKD